MRKSFISGLVILAFMVLFWHISEGGSIFRPRDTQATTTPVTAADQPIAADAMTVQFIDVGQGASTLISMGDKHILVDAGENDQGETVVEALKVRGVTRLALAIGTHPHSDHIGGMDTVLRAIPTDRFIMPDVNHTSQSFLSVLEVLEQQNIPVDCPKVGDRYEVGGMVLTILGPVEIDEDELNDCSIIARIESVHGSVLLPGDAEKSAERAALKTGQNLKADVLQLGHHGSSTSSTAEFVAAVDPRYGVIPVGKDNSYGHPHDETLALLEKRGIETYRTDWHGDILCTMDGSGITFITQKK